MLVYGVSLSKAYPAKTRVCDPFAEAGDIPDNHSFRHMFRTALRAAGVPDKAAEVLQGWSDGKGTMGDRYGEFPLAVLKAAIDQVKYEELDISHL